MASTDNNNELAYIVATPHVHLISEVQAWARGHTRRAFSLDSNQESPLEQLLLHRMSALVYCFFFFGPNTKIW